MSKVYVADKETLDAVNVGITNANAGIEQSRSEIAEANTGITEANASLDAIGTETEAIKTGVESIKSTIGGGLSSGIPPLQMRLFHAAAADSQCTLTFNEPTDTVIDKQCLCTIKGVMIRMSTSGYPDSPQDGELILDNKNLGAYVSDGYTVTGLANNVQHYFRAFPYSDHGVFNLVDCDANKAHCTPSEAEQCTVTVSADMGTLSPVTITLTNLTNSAHSQSYTLENGAGSHTFFVTVSEQYKISVSPVDLYITPDETVEFTAEGGGDRNISMGYVYAPAFEDCPWDVIGRIAEQGLCESVWSVGDEKTISIGGTNYKIVILGFNHDAYADGSGIAPVTFGLKNSLATTYSMNSTDTNSGGWGSSALRTILQSTILNMLPAEVKSLIRNVNKKASAGGQSSTINTHSDNLFLLSEEEVFGTTTYAKPGEGTQYEYYAVTSRRVKTLGDNGSAYYWWERSPDGGASYAFCSVTSSGSAGNSGASSSRGVSFGFCI